MKTIKILFAIVIAITATQSVNAQKAKANAPTTKTPVVINSYSCSMHPDVTSDKPGKCSKCGMNLNLSSKEKMKMEVVKLYTCPMHSEITSEKPGKCSKCDMDMKESGQAIKSYTCSMHPEIVSAKPGTCNKCGSNLNLSLKEKMKMEVVKLYSCPMHSDVTSDKPGKCSKCNMDLTAEKNR